MDERLRERRLTRAEKWVGESALHQFRRVQALCPMCGILAVDGVFLIRGIALALCLPCAKEAARGVRRWGE